MWFRSLLHLQASLIRRTGVWGCRAFLSRILENRMEKEMETVFVQRPVWVGNVGASSSTYIESSVLTGIEIIKVRIIRK